MSLSSPGLYDLPRENPSLCSRCHSTAQS